jgi:predicted nuclease with TOPRIM domain
MSDTTNVNASGNGLTHIAKQLTEARIEDRDRELITRVVTALLASGEERSRLLGEIDQLRGELAELRSRVSQLEKEKAEATSNRDAYLRAIYGLLPKPESAFTEEELSSLIHSGLSFDDIIKDLEALKDS